MRSAASKGGKAMTIRLPNDQAAELEAVSRADDQPVSSVIRSAIDEHIARRRKDPNFKARLQRLVEENNKVLERLAK